MLLELVIENFAVIDRIRVRFHPGLNLLTGETGSGKSIVVDALGLLFGGRASADTVRSGVERARVSGIFQLPPSARRAPLPAPLDLEGDEVLIEREILSNGKSRAFLDSRPVTAALLRELAPELGDIHGQHEQQRLFVPAAQLAMLDAYGQLDSPIAALYRRWSEVGRELDHLRRNEQEKLRLEDLWTFQRQEIEAAAPQPGEDQALESERRILLNLGRLQEGAAAAFSALYDAPESAAAAVRLASRKLEDLARIDPSFGTIRETLAPAQIAVEEASYALRDALSRLEASPERLEQVEERLAALEKLKRKYGPTLDDVARYLETVGRDLEALETAGERITTLEKERAAVAAQFEAAAAELRRCRDAAARKLEKQVEKELGSLAMERSRIRVDLAPAEWSETGADAARFLISANVGEEPRPLEKVASGGELSRIALALKTCLAGQGSGRTLVFDEVDAGVGGRAADGIGRRLKKLAGSDQVFCVTHLPQVAAFADHHYVVSKRERQGRTIATVEELDRDGRVRELARMLSGATLTPEALSHAEKLLESA